MNWLEHHLVGWEYFLPAVVLASVAATLVSRSPRHRFLPWALVTPWAFLVTSFYLAYGMDRFWYYARGHWGAMMIALVLATPPPFVAVASVALSEWGRALDGRCAAFYSIAFGSAMIPVTNIIASWCGDFLIPLLG